MNAKLDPDLNDVSVNGMAAARSAAIAGLGIVLLPEVLASRDVARGRLVRIIDGVEGGSGKAAHYGLAKQASTSRSQVRSERTCSSTAPSGT